MLLASMSFYNFASNLLAEIHDDDDLVADCFYVIYSKCVLPGTFIFKSALMQAQQHLYPVYFIVSIKSASKLLTLLANKLIIRNWQVA